MYISQVKFYKWNQAKHAFVQSSQFAACVTARASCPVANAESPWGGLNGAPSLYGLHQHAWNSSAGGSCPVIASEVSTLNECRRLFPRTSGFLWAQLQLGDDLQAFKLAILIQGHCHRTEKARVETINWC